MLNMFLRNGHYLIRDANALDLVEQVFDDEKDRAITDKILKDVEKVVNGVSEAMPLIESATIANLSREPLPENNEDDDELQRRQEVAKLAERLFVSGVMYNEYSEYNKQNILDKSYREYVFGKAEGFVYLKEKYLKDGKLC